MPKKESAEDAMKEAKRLRDLLQMSFTRSCRRINCSQCIFEFAYANSESTSPCWRAFCLGWVKGAFGNDRESIGKTFDFEKPKKKE